MSFQILLLKKHPILAYFPIYFVMLAIVYSWFDCYLVGNGWSWGRYGIYMIPALPMLVFFHFVGDTNYVTEHINFNEPNLNYEIGRLKYSVGFMSFATTVMATIGTLVFLLAEWAVP